jgi:hypothetical protein
LTELNGILQYASDATLYCRTDVHLEEEGINVVCFSLSEEIAVMTGRGRTVPQLEVKVHNNTAVIHASLDVPRTLNRNQLRIPKAILPITGVLLQVIHIALAPE